MASFSTFTWCSFIRCTAHHLFFALTSYIISSLSQIVVYYSKLSVHFLVLLFINCCWHLISCGLMCFFAVNSCEWNENSHPEICIPSSWRWLYSLAMGHGLDAFPLSLPCSALLYLSLSLAAAAAAAASASHCLSLLLWVSMELELASSLHCTSNSLLRR
jgi:hypothetical protein